MELVSPQFMNQIAVIAMAAGLLLAAWGIVCLYWLHDRDTESRLPHIDMPDGIQEVLTGIPPALLIFYVFIAISLIVYVFYIWLGGISY